MPGESWWPRCRQHSPAQARGNLGTKATHLGLIPRTGVPGRGMQRSDDLGKGPFHCFKRHSVPAACQACSQQQGHRHEA